MAIWFTNDTQADYVHSFHSKHIIYEIMQSRKNNNYQNIADGGGKKHVIYFTQPNS